MKWIGLTGGIASGKSTVSKRLIDKGIPVIDADVFAHEVMGKKGEAFNDIVLRFGPAILNSDGEIDRKKLGSVVFAEPSGLRFLEEKIHPWVQKKVSEKRKQLEQQGYVCALYDVPLLYEKNLEGQFDSVVVVTCPRETQISRLMSRNNMTRVAAEERLSQQIDNLEKERRADYVIRNDGSLTELFAQVDLLANELKK